jgi:hypothetical protein
MMLQTVRSVAKIFNNSDMVSLIIVKISIQTPGHLHTGGKQEISKIHEEKPTKTLY